MATTWTNENGYEEGFCACGDRCNTHPDANDPLHFCGDCGAVACSCCVDPNDPASRCKACREQFEERERFDADCTCVLDRMDEKNELLEVAIEAVIGSGAGAYFVRVRQALQGKQQEVSVTTYFDGRSWFWGNGIGPFLTEADALESAEQTAILEELNRIDAAEPKYDRRYLARNRRKTQKVVDTRKKI